MSKKLLWPSDQGVDLSSNSQALVGATVATIFVSSVEGVQNLVPITADLVQGHPPGFTHSTSQGSTRKRNRIIYSSLLHVLNIMKWFWT